MFEYKNLDLYNFFINSDYYQTWLFDENDQRTALSAYYDWYNIIAELNGAKTIKYDTYTLIRNLFFKDEKAFLIFQLKGIRFS
jgi:hypothetical protein